MIDDCGPRGPQVFRSCNRQSSIGVLDVERTIHDPDHARLVPAARVPVVDRGIRRILHVPPVFSRTSGAGAGSTAGTKLGFTGVALRRRDRGRRRPVRRRSGHEQVIASERPRPTTIAPTRRRRRRRREPPLRLLRARCPPAPPRGRGRPPRREISSAARRARREATARLGLPRPGRPSQAARCSRHAAAFVRRESVGRGNSRIEPELAAGERHGFAHRRAFASGDGGPEQIFAISRRRIRRALKRWLRTVDSPQFRISAISLVSRSSIS